MHINKLKQLNSGFTILEVMIVVAIAGILAAFALPSYQTMVKNSCMTSNTNLMVSSFQQARSEAVKRSTNVTITASNASDNANEWGNGWTVTIDEDSDNDGTLDTNEDFNGNGTLDAAALFRTVTLTCTGTTMDETGNDTTFVYDSSGFIDATGTFDVCDDRTSETGRQITINVVGRPNTNSDYTGCS